MKWDGVRKKVRRKAESEVKWVLPWSWLAGCSLTNVTSMHAELEKEPVRNTRAFSTCSVLLTLLLLC